MLVTFSSKAGADILMLGEHAKPLLRIAGKIIETPFPARGVFAADQLPDAIGRLERAIDADHAPTRTTQGAPKTGSAFPCASGRSHCST